MWIAVGLIGLVVLLCALLRLTPLGPILSYRLSPSYPVNRDQSIRLEGLEAQADVYFDAYGIPHIEAADPIDLARAVGFVQSRYRFFQLDVLRRFGKGRISELVGEQKILMSNTVEFDLAMRGWGFEERARIDLDAIPSFDRELILAFTDGVNQALERYRPVEYAILGVTPDPWEPSDCLIVVLVQAWSITHNWEQEALRLSLALNLGFGYADAIYPSEPLPGAYTIAPGGERNSLPPVIAPEIVDLFPAAPDPAAVSREQSRPPHFALGSLAELRPSASNAWVVGGQRSASGMPILSNDMHLSHTLPSLLFLQHIKTPDLDAVGVTMPGLPFLVGGHNGKIAWGATSAVADVVDLVIERPDPRREDQVLNAVRDCPLEETEAVIRVRDGSDFEERSFALRRTCNGPLLNDMYPGYLPEGAPLVSIRWGLPEVHSSIGYLYRANRAESAEELRDHLMKIPSPAQNIMVADWAGHIDFFSTGSVPVRAHHRGTFASPGWLAKYEWEEWTRKRDMPRLRDPECAFIVNTNNKVVSPYHHQPLFHIDSAPSYRYERAARRIRAVVKHDLESIQAIQSDDKILRARAVLPHIVEDLQGETGFGEREREALARLRSWDQFAGPDSVGATLFFAVYRQAILEALRDKLPASAMHLFVKQRYSTNVVDLWFEDADHPVWDDIRTEARETRRLVVGRAFRKALAGLEQDLGSALDDWKWGRRHVHHPKHLFGGRGVLGFMNLERVSLGGGLESVWKAHFNLGDSDDPFRVVAGPAFRFVVDLAEIENARFAIDTGESGWALSPHYGDMYEHWLRGELVPMLYDWNQIRDTSRAHLKLGG
jgi:penicillin amidase